MMPLKAKEDSAGCSWVRLRQKILHDMSCAVWTSAHQPDPTVPAPVECRSILCAMELNPKTEVIFKAAGPEKRAMIMIALIVNKGRTLAIPMLSILNQAKGPLPIQAEFNAPSDGPTCCNGLSGQQREAERASQPSNGRLLLFSA